MIPLGPLAWFIGTATLAVLVQAVVSSIRSGPGHLAPPADRAGRRRTHRGAAPARRRVQRPPR